MAEQQVVRGDSDPDVVVIRGSRFRRVLTWVAVGVVILLIAALTIVWIERRPIAQRLISHELESRGVRGSYTLNRVGLRTQQISNLVIGDPKHPDVTAKRVLIQMRLKWNGSVDVYRIVVPAHHGAKLSAVPRFGDVQLEVFKASAKSINDTRHRIAFAHRKGSKHTEHATVRNTGRAAHSYYAMVSPQGRSVYQDRRYTLRVGR